MNLDSYEYYTFIPKHHCDFYNQQKGINMYSFSLNPKELQPSGSLNFSKIDDAYLQLTLNKVVNYQNPISVRCYSLQYNLLRTFNGVGGLGFNI